MARPAHAPTIRSLLLAIALAGAPGTALSADPAVNLADSNAHLAGDCHGRDASLAGSGNTVTIHGFCRAFQIAGDGNRVLVNMAPGGTIKVYGHNNQVSWTSSGRVEITTVGPGNTVTRTR